MSFWMFSRPHGEKMIFLDFGGLARKLRVDKIPYHQHLPKTIPKLWTYTLVDQFFHVRVLYSWFLDHKTRWRLLISPPQSIRPRCTPQTIRCVHSGDSTSNRELDSNVSYFLILIRASLILVCTHFTWLFFPFTSVSDEWDDEYTSFRPKSFNVYSTNL